MYTPSFDGPTQAVEVFVRSLLETGIGIPIRNAGKEEECVEQIKNDKAIINELKSRLANAIGTRKKASRNRFMNELGYTMYNRRISKYEHY